MLAPLQSTSRKQIRDTGFSCTALLNGIAFTKCVVEISKPKDKQEVNKDIVKMIM